MTVYSRPVTQLRALPSLVLFLFILTMSVSLGNAMAAKKAVLISSFSGLSSSHFAQLVQALRPIDTQQNNNNKLLYVPTASYSKPLENTRSPGDYRRRCRYDAKQKAEFVRNVLGFDSVEMLEIDHADMTPTKIRDAVEEAGCIYVAGGNTFYLQKHIIRSQFWEGIKSSLERGCIYIGQSAGAIVAGPTIETAYWKGWDDPAEATEIEWREETHRGLKLSPFPIFPHYIEDVHAGLVEEKKKQFSVDTPYEVQALTDGQALVIQTHCQQSRSTGISVGDAMGVPQTAGGDLRDMDVSWTLHDFPSVECEANVDTSV